MKTIMKVFLVAVLASSPVVTAHAALEAEKDQSGVLFDSGQLNPSGGRGQGQVAAMEGFGGRSVLRLTAQPASGNSAASVLPIAGRSAGPGEGQDGYCPNTLNFFNSMFEKMFPDPSSASNELGHTGLIAWDILGGMTVGFSLSVITSPAWGPCEIKRLWELP